MADASRIYFDNPVSIPDEGDEETLAAIGEGIRDAETGHAVAIEEVRELPAKWITTSSSGNER